MVANVRNVNYEKGKKKVRVGAFSGYLFKGNIN